MNLHSKLLFAAVSWTCMAAVASAQSLVAAIDYNGTAATCAERVWVSPPGERAATRRLCLNETLAAGTTLETPAGVTLVLRSAHAPANVVTMRPSSRAKLVDNANGSSHTSFFGEIFYNVGQRLSYYFVKDPKGNTQAAMEGTVLRTVVRDDQIYYGRIEGQIRITQPVRMQVQGVSLDDDPARRDRDLVTYRYAVLNDANEQVGYGLDYYDTEFIPFDNLSAAIDFFDPQVQFLEPRANAGDPGAAEELADIYVTVGQLLVEAGQSELALGLYQDAMRYYVAVRGGDDYDPMLAEVYTEIAWTEIDLGNYQAALENFLVAQEIRQTLDPWDIWVADSLLDIGAVYFHADDLPTALAYTEDAIEELDSLAWVYVDAMEFAAEEGDFDYLIIMAENLVDNYELTAYAYGRLENDELSDQYLADAESLRQEILNFE